MISRRAGKYLTFRLAKDEFAIRAGSVREVMAFQPVSPVSEAPEYVKGLMNRGGKVVPVLDLRLKFGLSGTPCGRKRYIVVVEVQVGDERFLAGLIVDKIVDVVSIRPGEIRMLPDLGVPYLLGTVRMKQRRTILIDIDRVLPAGEMQGLRSMLSV